GLRFCAAETGMKTANTHFTRDVRREDGTLAYCGYGVDSIIACLTAVARHKFLGTSISALRGTYPDELEGRISVLIVHAAREVCRRNFEYMEAGKGAPVTAVFDQQGILVCDPYQGSCRIYDRPV
ncbi:MAG TPA: gfo/Idh/MocA family oxidoreductase, partial [Candidatus Hydrogenedentes bacterium]|nr:gfo/Idh/MocA family oxidoreductase [Candidatus Hydrogenedentota bacterium]